jgi:hypothetical protein
MGFVDKFDIKLGLKMGFVDKFDIKIGLKMRRGYIFDLKIGRKNGLTFEIKLNFKIWRQRQI